MSKMLLDSLLPSHMVAPKYSIANFSSINPQYLYMPENNLERPPDTAVNIQHLSCSVTLHNTTDHTQILSCWTINFGNISDIWNIIIIIYSSQERISFLDITTRSLVVYS